MTNIEKFKEIFDIEVVPENTCLSESCLCKECRHHDGNRCRVEKWWYADYQGTPTIPLSVIEDIKAEINTRRNRNITLFKADGLTKQELTFSDSAYVEVLGIIDKVVKECTHE